MVSMLQVRHSQHHFCKGDNLVYLVNAMVHLEYKDDLVKGENTSKNRKKWKKNHNYNLQN